MTVKFLELPDFTLEGGATLRPARLAYQTYGSLAPDRSNAILYPTAYADTHVNNEWLIGPGRALDTDRYFVIVPNMFGNGLSSSPSNTPAPYDAAHFPRLSIRDNVNAQHRLVTGEFGIERLQLVLGWSMGAAQTYQWAVSHPDMVARALPFCGSPRTSQHNIVFLMGLRAALTADARFDGGAYERPPVTGLRAFARVYAGWGFSQAFYWQERWRELGFSSLEDFVANWWEATFLAHDANDLLAMLGAWEHADVGVTPGHGGKLESALGSIRARLLAVPAEKDLYFPPEDEQWAGTHIPGGEVRVIPGVWGHLAGRGANPADNAFIERAIHDLLADPAA
ncbi:alpha/beta fold hydrolase [Streptosporangium sp. NPDC051023]|uniref:alpha/beta fold hydrolase n=1 Tax=Streptosporangium sp. NPDC051023 TaxID=3155410 RepID=UPI00344B4A0A